MVFDPNSFKSLEIDLNLVRKYGANRAMLLCLIERLCAANHANNYTKAYHNGRWYAIISAARIAKILGIHPRSAANYVTELKKCGALTSSRYRGSLYMYTVDLSSENGIWPYDIFADSLVIIFG